MTIISKTGLPAYHSHDYVTGKSAVTSSSADRTVKKAGAHDTVQFTQTDDTSVWETKARELLDQLTRNFHDIELLISSDASADTLKQDGAALGYGKHLILTEDFIRRMGSSEKDYRTCSNMLVRIYEQLASDREHAGIGALLETDKATLWTVSDTSDASGQQEPNPDLQKLQNVLDMLKQLSEKKDSQSIRYHAGSSAYQVSAHYARLARASSKAAIQSVVSDVYKDMASLRLAACLGDENESPKARKAIQSLQKLLLRSRQKTRCLDQETLLMIRKRKEAQMRHEQEVRQLQLELKKKKAARHSTDHALIKEGEAEERELERLKHTSSYLEHIPGGATDVALSTPVSDTPVSGEGAATDAVTVSPSISF